MLNTSCNFLLKWLKRLSHACIVLVYRKLVKKMKKHKLWSAEFSFYRACKYLNIENNCILFKSVYSI